MRKKDNVSELLYMVLMLTGFDKIRLYIFDPLKRMAILHYALEKKMNNEDEDFENEIEKYAVLKEIPVNFDDFFHGKKYDINDYLDFICRFNDEDAFVLDLKKLKNTPVSIKDFHSCNNIKSLALAKLDGANEEFYGYIVVDKSNSREYVIDKAELHLLKKIINHISDPIINALEKYEREKQAKKIIENINLLVEGIENGLSRDVLINNLLDSVFDVCGAVDLLQIKLLVGEGSYRYKYIRFNPKASIDQDKRIKIEALKGKEAKLSGITKWVVEKKQGLFVPNTNKPGESKEGVKKAIANAVEEAQRLSQDNPKRVIVERNNSEVNIPLMIGKKIYGVVDAHGRRAYSINVNTVYALNDLAPWIAFIVNEEYESDIEKIIKSIDFDYNDYNRNRSDNEYTKLTSYKTSEIGRRHGIDALNNRLRNSFYGNAIMDYTYSYPTNAIKNRLWYKFVRRFTWMVIMLAALSLPAAYFLDFTLVNPILSLIVLPALPFFLWMSKKAEKEYDQKWLKRENSILSIFKD